MASIESVLPDGYRANPIYSHVVIAQGQRLVFVAGQVPTNEAGELVGEGDMGEQAVQVYENLAKCLAAAGASFRDVVRLDTYVVNQTAEARTALFEVRKRYLPPDCLPAGATVGVASLGTRRSCSRFRRWRF